MAAARQDLSDMAPREDETGGAGGGDSETRVPTAEDIAVWHERSALQAAREELAYDDDGTGTAPSPRPAAAPR